MFSGRKDDPSEGQWDLSRDPFYTYDLREQIQVAPAVDKMDDRRYKKELFDAQKKWGHLIYAQDDAERLRIQAAKTLVDCNTKLNPLYDMGNLRE